MKHVLVALALAASCGSAAESLALTFTETFDTQTYAGTLESGILWDTAAGELTLQPRLMSSAGSLPGMPGYSVDMVIRGDRLFMAAQSAGVLVMNIQNPQAPSLFALWSYGTVNEVDVEGDIAALATTNGAWLLDVSNLAFPVTLNSKIGENVGSIELVGNRAYVGLNDSLRILDVSNPASPKWLGSVPLAGSAYGMAVYGNHVYCARGDNLSIVDVSDPTNPVLVATDPNGGSFVDVQVDGDHAYASIVDTGVRSYDVTDPSAPVTLATYSPGNYVYGLALSGTSLYVAWRSNGVIHLDVSDPANPEVVSSIDTPGSAEAVALAGRYTFVADGSGLQVLFNSGDGFSGSSSVGVGGTPQKIAAQGDFAYLAAAAGGMSIYSIASGSYGQLVGNLPLGNALDVAVEGDYAFVANGSVGFAIADVSDPTSPVAVVTVASGFGTVYRQVEIDGHLLYLRRSGIGGDGVDIYDVSDPTNPVGLTTINGGLMSGMAVSGGLVALEDSGLLALYNVRNPASPALLAFVSSWGSMAAGSFQGDVLYVAGGNIFRSFDISNPTTPALLDTLFYTGTARDMAVEGDYAWLATDAHGARQIGIANPAAMLAGYTLPGAAKGIVLHGEQHIQARDDNTLRMYKHLNRRYASLINDAMSANINPHPDAVLAARLTTTHTPFLSFELSTDGGSTNEAADVPQWVYFSSPGADVRWSATLNAARPETYPAMTELAVDMLYEFGHIASIADVGNDQGRQVRLTWERSGHDRVGSGVPIVEYALYRKQAPGLAPEVRTGARPDAGPAAVQLAGWDYVVSVPAEAEDSYSVVVPTLADSTSTSGIVYSTFLVRARTGTPGVHFDSYPDSGYSVDNLAPMAPANATVAYGTGAGNRLDWDPPTDGDFQYFRIYRDTAPGFTPGPANLAGTTTSHAWNDPGHDAPDVYYRISAVDFAGNESDFATPGGQIVGAGGAGPPGRLVLHPGAPNPFRGSTTLRFGLPTGAKVSIAIYDVGGRRVRSLDGATRTAGVHALRWDGRDDAGRDVSPGVYLVRLVAGGAATTGRLLKIE